MALQWTPTPILVGRKGVKLTQAPFMVSPDAMIDCMDVELFQGRVAKAKGWKRSESMTGPLPDALSPVRLIDQYFRFNGGEDLIIGTVHDLYRRTGVGTYDFLTPTYAAGTISITAIAPTIVVGVGTLFLANVKAGDRFKVDATGTWRSVSVVTDNTHLTLASAYPGVPHTGVAYTVRQLFGGSVPENQMLWSSTTVLDTFVATLSAVNPIQTYNGSVLAALGGNPPLCEFIGQFANRPVLINVIDGGTRYPQRVQWPDLGTLTSWTPALGSEAGSQDVYEGADWAMASYPYGNYQVLYKERSIHLFSYVGPPFTFVRQQIVSGIGLLAARAVADLGDEHLFIGPDNIYAFNGMAVEPIGDDIWQPLLERLDPARRDESMAFVVEERKTCHFVIPNTSGGYTDFVYHYELEDNQWTMRDVPATAFGYFKVMADVKWSDLLNAWMSYDFPWDSRQFQANAPLNLFGDVSGNLFELDTVDNKNGAAIDAFAEFGTMGATDGKEYVGHKVKEMAAIEITGDRKTGSRVDVSVGTGELADGVMTYPTTPLTYKLDGTQSKDAAVRRAGFYHRVKVRNANANEPFALTGYVPKWRIRGDR